MKCLSISLKAMKCKYLSKMFIEFLLEPSTDLEAFKGLKKWKQAHFQHRWYHGHAVDLYVWLAPALHNPSPATYRLLNTYSIYDPA